MNPNDSHPVTDEQKTHALEATAAILKRIDFRALTELRERLELPPEALDTIVRIYVSQFTVVGVSPPVIPQRILPMSAKATSAPLERITVRGVPASPIVIAGLLIGRRPEDWVVNDIRIDGVTQFEQSGDVPGDLFSTKAIGGFLRPRMFVECNKTLEIDATYIGENKAARFVAAVLGTHGEPTGSDVEGDVKVRMDNSKARVFAAGDGYNSIDAKPIVEK